MLPYCTDVIPLTLGAHRIDFLEEIIRAFLDAEHALLQAQQPSLAAQSALNQARNRLILQANWRSSPG